MPIDPSIIGQLQPLRMPNVLERVLMIDELKARRQAAAALQEQREAVAEQRRQQMAAADAAAQQGQRVRALFQTGQPVTFEMMAAEVGPEEATKILTGVAGLAKADREGLAQTAAAFPNMPDWMKGDLWSHLGEQAQRLKLVKTWPNAPTPELLTFLQRQGLSVKEQTELAQPKPKPTRLVTTRNPDGSETSQIVEDTPGQVFTSAPELPKVGTLEAYMRGYAEKRGLKVGQLNPQQQREAKAEWENAGRAASTDSERSARRTRLAAAVMQNPQLWDDLTPTDKGEIAPDLAEKNFTGFGRRLSDSAIGKMSESRSAIASLRDLRDVLKANEQYIGPVAGLAAMNPYSDARRAQADIDRVKQRVGKALEGGVLRKEDEAKYQRILATLRDTPATAIYKVDQIIEEMTRDLDTYVDEQRRAGRRVNEPKEAPAGSAGPADLIWDPTTKSFKKPGG